jgi:hypothetical protein
MPANTNKINFLAHRRRNLAVVAAVAVLVVGGTLIWNTERTASKRTAAPVTAKSLTGSGKQYTITQGEPSTPSQTAASSAAATTSTGSLAAPSGQLLNVQTVSLASGPGLESICQTIANASCDIRLTQGSTTKYVGAQSTGVNGSVIFDWNAKTVGLTAGQWNVQAVVTQNNATGVSHTEYLTVQP